MDMQDKIADSEPEVAVWCIQEIVGKERHVLAEHWVNAKENPDFVFPVHGSRVKGNPRYGRHKVTYHLTPLGLLDRKKHLHEVNP